MNGVKKLSTHAVLLILFVILALIFTYFVTLPYVQEKPNLDFEHLQAENTIRKYENYYSKMEDFYKEIQSLRDEWQELQKSTTVTSSSFSNDVTSMINKLGVVIENIAVLNENVHQGSVTTSNMILCDMPVQARLTMPRDKMISMFRYFESESNGRYDFKTVSLKTIDKETVEGRYVYYRGDYQVSFSGNLYYFKSLA